MNDPQQDRLDWECEQSAMMRESLLGIAKDFAQKLKEFSKYDVREAKSLLLLPIELFYEPKEKQKEPIDTPSDNEKINIDDLPF